MTWVKLNHECDLQIANHAVVQCKAQVGSIWACVLCGNLWLLVKIEGTNVFWDDEFEGEAELKERLRLVS